MKISQTLSLIVSGLLTVSVTNLNAYASEEPSPVPLEEVRRFSTAISQIKNYYVEPVKDKKLFDNAISGMLSGLDPHSAYLDEESFKELQTSTKGEFGGLGIEVTMEEGVIKVITPLDDTPAAKAGIKAGDYIIRIGKTPINGMTLKEAVKKMRGKKGSTVELTVLRKNAKNNPLIFKLTRDEIRIQSVKSKLLDKQFGYIRLTHFQALTAADMLKEINQLKQQAGSPLQGLVLDLRNNPGGLLDSAIQVSDAFIHNDNQGKEELIVYTEGRLPGSKFTAIAKPGDILDNAPIVVLINNGSASGSEIVAGALKDHHRAILMGTKTFGKGSVQTVLPLDNKHGIKLTTALYYTPAGISIQAKGIKPDIIVEELSLPKEQKAKKISALLSEADLSGHLEVKGNTTNKAKTTAKKDDKQLMYEDYQLYQALNLLKGMSVAKR